MFGLFKKKSKIEQLQLRYEKVMKEAFKLSTSSRTASDQKYAEANEILEEIDRLKEESDNQ